MIHNILPNIYVVVKLSLLNFCRMLCGVGVGVGYRNQKHVLVLTSAASTGVAYAVASVVMAT
jgi:hypothetical protein